MERWHKTLKGFLAKRPASSIAAFRGVLDEIVTFCNEVRPHRSRERMTSHAAYEGREKMPVGTLINQPHHRIRHDDVDVRGHVSLRHLGQFRLLNVGWRYRGERIRLYVVDDHVDIVTEDGEFIGEITLDPDRDYQPRARSVPTSDARVQVSAMSRHMTLEAAPGIEPG